MKFPKMTNYMLLLFLIILNLLLRYPRIPHESGMDSFVMHTLANSLTSTGNAKWILNPLSWLGMYPLSYPSGGVFLVAGFSSVADVTLEGTALLTCMILGVMGVLGGFLLGREVKDDDLFAFLVAAFFSLSPRFVTFTLWEIPTRSMFMAFTPYFLWALFRSHRHPSAFNIALLLTLLFIVSTAHRLFVIILVIILAYISTYIFMMFMRILRLRFPKIFLKQKFKRFVPTLSIIILLSASLLIMIFSGILKSYEKGVLITGSNVQIQLFNLGVSLTRSAGIILPVIFFGALYFATQRNKELKEPFLIFLLIMLIPTLFLRQYTGFYIITVTSIFLAAGILILVRLLRRWKILVKTLIASSLIATIAFGTYMIDYQQDRLPSLSAETYNLGLRIKHLPDGTTITNVGFMGSRMASISGKPYLPIGGATNSFQGPDILAFGFENVSDLTVVQIPLQELTLEDDSPFILLEVQAEYDWVTTLDKDIDLVSQKLINKYNIRYAAENKELSGYFMAYGNLYDSEFMRDAYEKRYKIYENEEETLWHIFP